MVAVVMVLSGEVFGRLAVARSDDSSKSTAKSPVRDTTGWSGATVGSGEGSCVGGSPSCNDGSSASFVSRATSARMGSVVSGPASAATIHEGGA